MFEWVMNVSHFFKWVAEIINNRGDIGALQKTDKVHETALATIRAELDELKRGRAEHGGQIIELQKKVMYLEVYQEASKAAIAQIHELQGLSMGQSVRLENIVNQVETDLLPRINDLEGIAPTREEKNDVMNMRKRLKTNMTRAKKRVAAA